MSIKQIITFNSNNRYFAGFLNHIIDEIKIDGSAIQETNKITLILDDKDEKKLEQFSIATAKYLPHSIFLGDVDTKSVDIKVSKSSFISPTYDIALCPRCIEELTTPSSDKYLDDTIICNHYNNNNNKQKPDNIVYSPHYSDKCTVLLCNPSKIDEHFTLTNDEKKVLFSIEKPTIKATIKDEELKQITGKFYINLKSPHTTKASLVALNAQDSQIDYLFFEDTNITKAVVVQKNIILIRDNRICENLLFFNEDKEINRFLNIANENNKDRAIGAYLSVENNISFMVNNEIASKKVLVISPFDLNKFIINIDKNKNKLLENFSKKYPKIINELSSGKSYGLFETLHLILDLDSSFYNNRSAFDNICDKSYEYRGNGGLKIDMNFDNNGFDYISFFGSIMSFKLADTNSSHLAYSIFEAFGDMTIETINQLKKRFKIDDIIMLGDMFENTVLYSRILDKFQLAKPFFSKKFALDS